MRIDLRFLLLGLVLGLLACQSSTPRLSAKLLEPGPSHAASSSSHWREVEELIREQRAKSPGTPREKLLLKIAYLKLEDGTLDIAEALADEVMRSRQPDEQKAAWNLKALIAQKKKRPYAAERAWQNALEIDPEDLLVKRNLGYFYLQYAQFQKVVDLYPEESDDFHVQLQLLIAKRNLEESKEVDARCEDMLSRYPEDKYVLFNCALHEFQNNRHAKRAGELLEHALAVVQLQDPLRVEIQEKWQQVKTWATEHQSED